MAPLRHNKFDVMHTFGNTLHQKYKITLDERTEFTAEKTHLNMAFMMINPESGNPVPLNEVYKHLKVTANLIEMETGLQETSEPIVLRPCNKTDIN